MGSGPSLHLASLRNPANLILISPYTSIGDVTKNMVGKLISNIFVKNRFQNIKKIPHVECPILLIHGMKDDLVPYEHSVRLSEAAVKSKLVKLDLMESMTHNKFNMYREIINPIFQFWKSTEYNLNPKCYIKKEAL